MNATSLFTDVSHLLSEWYQIHKRDLPWRRTTNPYQIWISEIILQQTRVEQGLPYYKAILERFPDVDTLAAGPMDDLLKHWQGLGYYSRARNMHTAATQIVHEFGGKFPDTYERILQLKGVGEYTASAVASIAFRLPHAVVDGNVFRVLSRLFGIDIPINGSKGKKMFSQLAEELLDKKRPDTHNQAIMDFGALVCTPNTPRCPDCPLSQYCVALASGKVQELPVKNAGAPKQERFLNYLVFIDQEFTWIQQRRQKDIWQNLWEFPLIETPDIASTESLLKNETFKQWTGQKGIVKTPVYLKHVLSHRILHTHFFTIHTNDSQFFPNNWKRIETKNIHQIAVSRLTERYIQNHLETDKK